MKGLGRQLATSLKLHARNRMGLLYGYLFPVVFLLAFRVLYLYDRVPLVRHMGELLTVTILGGACFGLATTLVSERERGVWRRFKLVPVHTGTLILSTVIARYVLLLSAGVLQLLLARAFGMPWPEHPLDLFLTFTLASFAFLGVGLVIAMLADNVPAVQALGQSIFLPMLILGGVAVPITALPDWAQQVSAFFPGRYSVEAIQASVNGAGIGSVGFAVVALVFIGLASCVAAGGMFRWDAQQRYLVGPGRGWLAVALLSWVTVGGYAVYSGHAQLTSDPTQTTGGSTRPVLLPTTPTPAAVPDAPSSSPQLGETQAPNVVTSSASPATAGVESAPPSNASPSKPTPPAIAGTLPAAPPTVPPAPTAESTTSSAAAGTGDSAEPWRNVRLQQIDEDLVFSRLPPDDGVVTPVSPANAELDDNTVFELTSFEVTLMDWAPGKVADPVQRVRNLLYVAAVVDVFQMPTEPYVPLYVFEQIQRAVPTQEDLLKILYWIAVRPDEGDVHAVDLMGPLGITRGQSQVDDVRNRTGIYAVKLIGRITGKRPGL